ncbi:MAG TPA: lytic murein transglycosylase B [Paucimonas sp.]|nr:lytic murein transglycosylase B [Paucimonas sp.]
MKFLALPVLLTAAFSLLAAPAGGKPAQRPAPTAAKAPQIAGDPEELGEFADFTQWTGVPEFIDQMVEKHDFPRPEVEDALRKARYVELAIQLVKPAPPGKPKNWAAYRARFLDPVRIKTGVAFWNDHEEALARAERQYGVPAEIIIGILGVETIYGRNTGKFRVMDAITTLAFAYPETPNRKARMEYFRGELENTLLFARDSGIDPFTLLGSYAGAIGLPQFMPGSILRYAVDFDGDDKIDLRQSPQDAIGSIASFLSRHGWKRGEPIAFPAGVTAATDGETPDWKRFIGQPLEAKFRLEELKQHGISVSDDVPTNLGYGLVDLQNGFDPTEYWLGTANFYAIAHYNRSFFYAMSVVELGRAVRNARGGAQDEPPRNINAQARPAP